MFVGFLLLWCLYDRLASDCLGLGVLQICSVYWVVWFVRSIFRFINSVVRLCIVCTQACLVCCG